MIPVVLSFLLSASLQQSSVELKPEKSRVCDVLEAAYSASVKSRDPTYPRTLIQSRLPPTLLAQYVAEYKAQLPLSSPEFDDLKSRQQSYMLHSYLPDCKWKGVANHVGEGADDWSTSFSNPIFSKSGKLALVDVSFYEGRFSFAHGSTCVVRKIGRIWDAKCIAGWIT